MRQEGLMSEDLSAEDALMEGAGMVDMEDYDDDDDEAYAEHDDDESYEASAEYDEDDDDDDESEGSDAEFLGLLGSVAPALIGGLAPSLIRGASRLFSSKKRRTPRYNRFSSLGGARGIKGAVLNTPAGRAYMRLPKSVTPISVHNAAVRKLTSRDNKIISRLNRIQRDVTKVDKKSSQAQSLAASSGIKVSRLSRIHKRDIKKLKSEQQSSSTMNMMLSMMQIQSLTSQIDSLAEATGAPVPASNNSMMTMLPLMMMGDSDGGDNTMMMMMMMMSQR